LPVTDVIEASKLTDCELSSNGESLRTNLRKAGGEMASVVLPIECLSALLMTFPGLIEQALRRRYRDPSLRMVYPAESWELQQAADGSSLILSLATPDQFQVSFALSFPTGRRIAAALGEAEEPAAAVRH
jgi:hypothetical protein